MQQEQLRHLKLSLRRRLDEARRQTDQLFDVVDPAAFYHRPIAERYRIIFYLGHIEAFDWNMICGASFGMKAPSEEFTRLFAFGIDPVCGRLPTDAPSDWPSVEMVKQHNSQARQAVDDCLEKVDFSKREQRYVENGLIFWTAIEHRLMHAETFTYMLHWLPFEHKHAVASPMGDPRPAPKPRQVPVPAGPTTLGQRDKRWQFGWDNEFAAHSVHVPAFNIDLYKVTNAQYLKFIRAGGYRERSFWTDWAWTWLKANGIQFPKFWLKRGERWWYRAMFGEIPLPPSWPVYVSHAEASAYTRWVGKSLPTEAEFHRAAFGAEDERQHVESGDAPAAIHGNFDSQRWEPLPVDLYAPAAGGFGAVELVGNGWEWTSSAFVPFDGFERFPFYPGYSADFFDKKHFVIKGASARTAFRLTRKSFRNWFQPHYPHIYAGFRCVERSATSSSGL